MSHLFGTQIPWSCLNHATHVQNSALALARAPGVGYDKLADEPNVANKSWFVEIMKK